MTVVEAKDMTPKKYAELLIRAEVPIKVLEDLNKGELIVAYVQGPSIVRDGKNRWIMLVPHSEEWVESLKPEVWDEIKKVYKDYLNVFQ